MKTLTTSMNLQMKFIEEYTFKLNNIMGVIQSSVDQLANTAVRASMYKQGIKAVEKTGKQTAALTNTINTLAADNRKFNKTFSVYRDPEIANKIARAEAERARSMKPINIYKETQRGKQ